MRFCGKVGYAVLEEKSPGVIEERIVERQYRGDVRTNYRRLQAGENVNDDVTVGNEISIVADAYAYQNFYNMRYLVWIGVKWKINSVDVQRPRLVLSLGGVYNGKGPETASGDS